MFYGYGEILCLLLFSILVIIIYNVMTIYYKHPLTEKEIKRLNDTEKEYMKSYIKNLQEPFTH